MTGPGERYHFPWWLIVAIFVAALAPRLALIGLFPQAYGDAGIYLTVARNIFQNLCVSMSDPATAGCAPHWGGNQLPGYPAFISLVWFVQGESLTAVRITQALAATAAICWMAFALGRLTNSRPVVLLAALILALSPVAIGWPRHLFTETLALATTTWVFAELVLSLADRRLRIIPLALALAAAVFVRYDGIWLCLPTALCAFLLHPPAIALGRGMILALLMMLPLAAWSVRSISAGLPAIPSLATANQEVQLPLGYLEWGGTWSVSEYQLASWAFPVYNRRYSAIYVDASAFDGPEERARVESLLARMVVWEGKPLPQDIDAAFAALADERKARNPARRWFWLPLKRAAVMWTNPYSSSGWPAAAELDADVPASELKLLVEEGMAGAFRLVFKYPVLAAYKALTAGYRWLICTLIAILLVLSWTSPALREARFLLWLAVAYAMARTGFFSFFFANSTRYIIECVPGLEVAAVVCLAALWRRHGTSAADTTASAIGR
jgi:hypothetical protein